MIVGNMRRGVDDLLAISPPPEFQDRPALPPPVFRDSPSSETPGFHLEVPGDKKYSVQQLIQEFADKISYDILNEALIIATIVPGSGSPTFLSHNSSPSCPFSSASSDSDSLSTTTSWEYLSRSNSLSNRRYESDDVPQYSKPNKNNKNSESTSRLTNNNNNIRKSSSEGFGNMKQTEIVESDATACSIVLPVKTLTTSVKQKLETSAKTKVASTEELSISEGNNEEDVCYTVPYQCDIYSLPIDSIPLDSRNGSSNKLSNRRGHREKLRRGPKSFPLSSGSQPVVFVEPQGSSTAFASSNKSGDTCNEESSQPEINRGVKLKKSQVQRSTASNIDKDNTFSQSQSEKNNNNGKGEESLSVGGSHWSKKRRSKSVEIDHHNSINYRKSSHQPDPNIIAEDENPESGNSKEKRNFGRTLLNLFRRSRSKSKQSTTPNNETLTKHHEVSNVSRALPSPPSTPEIVREEFCTSPVAARDFAASIEKVKDCGWYWGPLSSEAAEDLLRGEPDGSFIVRDSSDAHYIFSLTFKLNGLVRHVRIEHDQGNFSFGPLTRFKSATIVDFVEKAVAHSRSGRYLFFLHRRPVLGPMRVQLLHPYSRYRHPRSLQHMCRFVILKYVRRDLLNTLPLPKPLVEYLNTPHYYFEHQEITQ